MEQGGANIISNLFSYEALTLLGALLTISLTLRFIYVNKSKKIVSSNKNDLTAINAEKVTQVQNVVNINIHDLKIANKIFTKFFPEQYKNLIESIEGKSSSNIDDSEQIENSKFLKEIEKLPSDIINSRKNIMTGYKDLDDHLNGLTHSSLITIGGRMSTGKTSLVLNIARHLGVVESVPVLIFSLEGTSQSIVDRLIAAESRVDTLKIISGKYVIDSEFEQVRVAIERLTSAPIYIDDAADLTIEKIERSILSMKGKTQNGLIVIDYLQLISTEKEFNSPTDKFTYIVHKLKNCAKKIGLPVIVISQLSNDSRERGGKPRISDLYKFGSIVDDSDIVMVLNRNDTYDSDLPNMAELRIEKNRFGPTGAIDLYFDDRKTTFLSVDKQNLSSFGDNF